MDSLCSSPTLMSTTTKLDKHEGKKMDIKGYQGMIDILLYLTTCKPNIMFSVGLCARFKTSHRESHLRVVKCIFRYLKEQLDWVFGTLV